MTDAIADAKERVIEAAILVVEAPNGIQWADATCQLFATVNRLRDLQLEESIASRPRSPVAFEKDKHL